MKKLIFTLCTSLCFLSCSVQKNNSITKTDEKPYVLLVSFDGFRYDYAEKYHLPHFKQLMKEGTYSQGMLPSFPSKTFPNHYTIITGMYPGHHGIVDNKFYSPSLKSIYSIRDRKAVQNPKYYSGTPLWQWLQTHGIKTASFFWVGSETPIQGMYPNYYFNYDEKVPYEERIEQVMKWFSLPEKERPHFITLYFELVDTAGHHTGTNSKAMMEATKKADELVGKIMDGVKASHLPITTIFVSDHGMIDMNSQPDKLISLEEIQSKIGNDVKIINNGMHCQIYLNDKNNKEKIYSELKNYFQNNPHIKVYKKEDTPNQWHYNNHEHIGDILLFTEAPYYMINSTKDNITKRTETWGTHGYNPYTTPEMKAIFYAVGNNIKKNNKIQSFENVNIYPFITHLFHLDNPKEIDGKKEILLPILEKQK